MGSLAHESQETSHGGPKSGAVAQGIVPGINGYRCGGIAVLGRRRS